MSADAPPGDPLGASRLEVVRDLFTAASELDGAARAAFLDRACGTDGALRDEVGDLLGRTAELGAFLAEPMTVPRTFAARQNLALPGDRIGGFEVLQFLGRGGTGEVYRARASATGPDVALKLVSTIDLGEHARERFAREAKIASEVRHPHLVEVVAFGEDEGMALLFLAMRLVAGPTLAEVLADFVRLGSRPDAASRLAFLARFREIAAALAALHARGCVHRDVKPANVMFDGTEAPAYAHPAILVDLGLARDGVAEHSSSIWLAFGYAPPERFDGRMDETGDVYSLGLTMYDLFTGGTPEARQKWARRSLPLLSSVVPDVDTDLSRMVATATDPRPRWRYPHAGALADDLDAVLTRRRIAERRAPLARRVWRSACRNPRRTIAIAPLVLLMLVALALGVLDVAQASAAAARVSAAYARGDLTALERGLAAAPDLATLWIPEAITELARAQPTESTPEQAAFARVRRGDHDDALRLAACHLERDGPIAHPLLAAFLAHEMEGGDRVAARLAARLFRERPDADAGATLASAPFRRWFTATMRGAPPDLMLNALSALGGCGDADSARDLLAWAADGFAGVRTQDLLDARRLATQTIAHIAARSSGCGFRAALLPVVSAAALRQLRPDRPQHSETHWRRFVVAGACLALHHVWLRRAAGLAGEPLWDEILDPCEALRVRAARADPDLIAQLQAGAPVVTQLLARVGSERDVACECGFVAGSLDDPRITASLLHEAQQLARGETADREASFRGGLALARDVARGQDPWFVLDADTHLGAQLDRENAAPMALLATSIPAWPEILACWRFVAEPSEIAGSAEPCIAHATTRGTDEQAATAHYARLYLPGVSKLTLSFTVQPIPGGHLALHLEAQKNARPALPWDGVALLEVWLDGELIADHLRLVASSQQRFMLPLCQASEVQRRTLEIRLGEESETPVRLYRVSIMR